jgi:thiol-disulfide isomerase/thioredoxin
MKLTVIALLALIAQEVPPAKPLNVTLVAHVPARGESLRWSPKGAKVELTRDGETLAGRFALGPQGSAPIAVRLERRQGEAHFDVLDIDIDRNGKFTDSEGFMATPSEQRGKWWSSFEAELTIPNVAIDPTKTPKLRPYPVALWFVEDPQEPDAPPALRWSRRGWHEGQLEIDGKPAFVLITEMEMDGVFDQRDCWALARDRATLLKADARGLERHCWLDGKAYRATVIDPDGLSLAFEPFDPGITQAAEAAHDDIYAPDRNVPRAAQPLAFGKDLDAALARAAREHKRVLVDFETTWCGPCATMNQLVYTSAAVVDAAKDVLAVKVDGDEHRELTKKYTVGAYPTILVLDSSGAELRRSVGYRSVVEMVAMLKP